MHKVGTSVLRWAETAVMAGPLLHMMWPFKSVQLAGPAVLIDCYHMLLKIKEEHKESTHDSKQLSQAS